MLLTPTPSWTDLCNPSDAERAAAAASTGLRIPSAREITEIETSSRLRLDHNTLTLTMPAISRTPEGIRAVTSLGFVLSPRHLLTLRFGAFPAFDTYIVHLAEQPATLTSVELFVGLLEAIVDRLADVLETLGEELDALSKHIFQGPADGGRRDATMQATLRRIGGTGDLISNLRDTLLGAARLVAFVAESGLDWLPEPIKPRLRTLRQDIASLSEHDGRLAEKVQFLLDATLGFLNIEQNNGLKILTIVSIVGIPPTLIASIYGMNFHTMPELSWAWGYQYGLTMIALSVVLPLAWFKWKGWL